MTRLVRIEIAGPERRARRLVFGDGSESRTTSKAAIRLLGLVEEAELDLDSLEEALIECEYPLAKERALQLLGYRERSRAELEKKLVASGYPQQVAAAVVSRFSDIELVDDDRFAQAWVRSRRAAGYGVRRIARELKEKGVSEEIAESALGLEGDSSDQLEAARSALRGQVPRDRAEADRLVRRLVGRGFELGVALDAVGRPRQDDETLD